MTQYLLAGDIGGTHPRLAMLDSAGKVVFRRDIDPHATELPPLLNDFLRDAAAKGFTTDTCCLSVAGAVHDNKCLHMVHVSYPVDDEQIRARTMLRNVLVLNDFAAIGAAIATLHDDSPMLRQVPMPHSHAAAVPVGNRAVLGPGTGLGVAYLPRFEKGYLVLPSEGGHSYAPYIAAYRGLIEHVRLKLGADQLDYEAFVSGQGIRHFARYFLDHPHALAQLVAEHHHFHTEAEMLRRGADKAVDDAIRRALDNERNNKAIDAAEVIARSFHTSVAARVAMRVFAHFLGAAAQSVALTGITTGGVFIAGGIASKNADLLCAGDVMRGYLDHHRPTVRDMLRTIPVFVVADYDVSFLGCHVAGRRRFPVS